MEIDGPDEVVAIGGEDEEMLSAINSARQSVKQFLKAFFSPKGNQRNFLLKVGFEDRLVGGFTTRVLQRSARPN